MKFPIFLQRESSDCGPVCLQMVAAYYGKRYPLEIFKDKCRLSKGGVSLLDISDAAEGIGLKTIGVKISWKQLSEDVIFPCIIHWNQKHFIVVYKVENIKGDKEAIVYVADPAYGLLQYTKKQFCDKWLANNSETGDNGGIVLLLEPTINFHKEINIEEAKYKSYLLKYILPFAKQYFKIFIAIALSLFINALLPLLTQSVVDVGIENNDINYIILILFAQLILAIGQMFNNITKNWIMLYVTLKINLSLISDFLQKLLKLPISFFDSRTVGDIIQRIGDSNRIQSFLTGSLISIIMSLLSLCLYGYIMSGYDFTILLIFVIGSLLYLLWVIIFIKRRRVLDYLRFQESSASQTSVIQLISCIQDIKLNNCERKKRWEWEKIQAKLYKLSIKSLTLNQIQDVGSIFIEQTKNILISFFAAKYVIYGEMTLGMMMSTQYIIGQMNAPLLSFISFFQNLQDAKMSMERINEIHAKDDEELSDSSKLINIPINVDIDFRNVSFSYRDNSLILEDISFKIPSKKVTAIVGTSGSGKTTILKLLLGFYKPTKGKILLGGRPLDMYSLKSWRDKCGVVMQDGNVFSDSILNNIGVSDDVPNLNLVCDSAKKACISDFIEGLPLQYDTKLGTDGQGLSAGQKQRLLIARTIYKNSEYLFFDEATNSLDSTNERSIMNNLDDIFKNKTVVIVAHRLSTVINADNIIVLHNGRIVEQGSHKELISNKCEYYKLVQNQLTK